MARIATTAFASRYRHPVGPGWRCFRHNLASEPSAADELDFFPVPKGVKFLDALIFGDRLDTGGAPTLSNTLRLSDGTTTFDLVSGFTGLRSATASSRVGRAEDPDAFGFVTDSHTWRLYIVWVAVAQTFAAGEIGCALAYTQADVKNGA